jgi:phospholipase/carboxylesterase
MSVSPLFTAAGLQYRVRHPVPDRPESIVILLHGVGADEYSLAPLGERIDPAALVVLPRGRLEFGAGQFGWFAVRFGQAGPQPDLVEAELSRKALIAFIAELQRLHGVSPSRTTVSGFSQGGIMSASVALTSPASIAGFAVLSGRILPELEPAVASRGQLADLRGLIVHGQHDSKLPVDWAHRAEQLLQRHGVHHQTLLYQAGHELSAAMQEDFLRWLAGIHTPAKGVES